MKAMLVLINAAYSSFLYLLMSLRINLDFKLLNFRNQGPILVYQMGKVGSSTIYRSLKRAHLGRPVYQVHFLSQEGIEEAKNYFHRKETVLPKHLWISQILRRKLDKKKIPCKIITLTRDPIARDISDMFQNLHISCPDCINQKGEVDSQKMAEALKRRYENYHEDSDYTSSWFDLELKKAFGIDVFEHPFDQKVGFSIIHQNNVDLLIMRMEDLSPNFSLALSCFLGYDVKMIKDNMGSQKQYVDAYNQALNEVHFSDSLCRRIYGTKYARHFYTESMLDYFFRKWCCPRREANKKP